MKVRRVTVLTPCRNAQALIEDTVLSVVNQSAHRSGRVELEYLVLDGASNDGTPELATAAGRGVATVESEPDRGMYDALAKGLRRATGDVICYLNAGDLFSPTALDVVADVMEETGARWLTGYSAFYNAKGHAVQFTLPYRFRRNLVKVGAYGKRLPFIQQESTFWTADLLPSVDLSRLRSLRLAGDAYLWRCFADLAELHIAEAHLGGFRRHGGHLSADLKGYWAEADQFLELEKPWDRAVEWLDWALWKAPPKVKKRFNRRLYRFDHRSGRWA